MELERYTFVLLRRGPRAQEHSGDELDRLQEAHLAYLDAMRERGALPAAGPFSEQPDETLRGFCIYGTAVEETRGLVDADPSIRSPRSGRDGVADQARRCVLSPDLPVNLARCGLRSGVRFSVPSACRRICSPPR